MHDKWVHNVIYRIGLALLYLPAWAFIFSLPVHSQPAGWDITYFSTEDGLYSNHVNCVTKCSRGDLWIGALTVSASVLVGAGSPCIHQDLVADTV